MIYDYVIVGAGPTGLTLAWYLAKYGKTVMLIDKETTFGGCHRVRRVDGLFTEHGPRVIISNYFGLKDMLTELNLEFDKMYTPYYFSVNTYMSKMFKILSVRELGIIGLGLIKFFFVNDYLKKITVGEFLRNNNFLTQSIAYIDKLCRLTEGSTVDTYTMWEFFEIFNQNYFYTLYEPKIPNDVGLFKFWSEALIRTGRVDILLGTEIKLIHTTNQVNYIQTNTDQHILARKYIFAVPPKPMLRILEQSPNPNLFGPFDQVAKWGNLASYIPYLTVTFHWDKKYNAVYSVDFPDTSYGIIYIDQSAFTDFADPRSKTVIVCSATILNTVSTNNGKTANQCSESELILEVFSQLKLYQPHLPDPTDAILSPDVYKKTPTQYDTIDTAFVLTTAGYRSFNSIYNNLYWVGIHNGNSLYAVTSMEAAIQNAISLLHTLLPETKSAVLNHDRFTIRQLFFIILICIVIICAYKMIKT